MSINILVCHLYHCCGIHFHHIFVEMQLLYCVKQHMAKLFSQFMMLFFNLEV